MDFNIKLNKISNENFFNNLKFYHKQNTPFIAYRKKQSNDLQCHVDEKPIELRSISNVKCGFVFMPFDKNNTGYQLGLEHSYITKLNPKMSSNLIYPSVENFIDYSNQKKEYIKCVNQIKGKLDLNFSKVVFTHIFELEQKEINPIRCFKNLLNLNLDALCYLFFHPEVGFWLGASPETLVNFDGKNLETVALAGTKKIELEKWSLKETQEQKIVEKYILDKLKPVSKIIKTTKTETIKAGNIEHLKSTITAKTKLSPAKLIDIIHPTPAVCGFPFEKAVKEINEMEKHDRSYYTGYLGLVSKKCCETYVNLRCTRIKNGKATLYSGGGITKESVAESEWNEIVSKSGTILKTFFN